MKTKDDIIYRNQFTWNMTSSMDEQSGIIWYNRFVAAIQFEIRFT